MNLLCKIGIHRPLSEHHYDFKDKVSGKTVYNSVCSCGKRWMVNSRWGWFGFKTEKEVKDGHE